ncbi:hypothetical protein WJX73_003291 [Symbiochloris irregularis]|uniref:Uncharacterized protein n=1 Tax=Symbiochloris irregularis TaxID=706552 RepID=A0AAW1PVV4_9CHLO
MAELSGNVKVADYEAEEYVASMEPVTARLKETFPDGKFDNKSTASFVAQLLQFMEDALGLKALPPRPCPKIPAKLLQDLSASGAVFTVAKKCEEIRRSRNLKKVDFANPARRKENLDILLQVRAELQRLGLLSTPRIHLHASLQDLAPELQGLGKQLGAELLPSSSGASYIIYPFGAAGDPDDGVQYMRKLSTRGSMALVHWWYLPDSYNGYIPADTAPEVAEPDKRIKGPWKVYARWLQDSAKYNEWMNPIDYETEEAQAEQEAAAAESPHGAQLKDRKSSDLAKRKRADPGSTQANKRVAGAVARPGVTKVKGTHRPPVPAVLEDITHGQRDPVQAMQPGHGIPRSPRRHAEGPSANGTNGLAPKADGADGTEPNRVPACAAWFNCSLVHVHERRLLPEFFEGKTQDMTPAIYRQCRNAVVSKYRDDSGCHLSLEVATASLTHDARVVQRVWGFLNSWGIINFQAVDGQGWGNAGQKLELPPAPPKAETGAPDGHRTLHGAAGSNMAPLYWPSAPSAANAVAAATGLATGGIIMNGRSPQEEHGASALIPPDPHARYRCSAMPWVDCTACRYHCTKVPDVDLCPQAFAEGRFPAGCSANDFIRVDQQGTQKQGPWRDLEELLLLEGVQLFGDNWAKIASHVGTKSQVQCILHLLQMPIGDEVLGVSSAKQAKGIAVPAAAAELTVVPSVSQPDPQNGKRPAGKAESPPGEETAEEEPAAESSHHAAIIEDGQPIPFAETGNPIMAQMAFLAAVVGPKVAAAAAQAALETLAAEHPDAEQEGAGGTATDTAPSAERVRLAASTALGAAAVKARIMADEEAREIDRCVEAAALVQMGRINTKLRHFEPLDHSIDRERQMLVLARDKLVADRIQLQRDKMALAASLPGYTARH